MLKMKQCEEWSNEADAWWLNLQALESTNALMATQLFSNDRRSVGASTLALSSAWTQLSNELQVRLNHLQKVGGRVLDDRGSQATGCQLPGWPPVPAARAAAAGEDDAPVGVSRHDSEDSISTSASSSPSGCADDDADGSRSAKAVFFAASGSGAGGRRAYHSAGDDEEVAQPQQSAAPAEAAPVKTVPVEAAPDEQVFVGMTGGGGEGGDAGAEAEACSSERQQLIVALAKVYSHLANLGQRRQKCTAFHSRSVPRWTMLQYLSRIATYFHCSDQCLVLSLVYIDRIVKMHPDFVVSTFSVHRVLMTSVMVAAKFWDDIFYSNEHYAKVGGVTTRECCMLEAQFCKLIDWRLHVLPDEYSTYLQSVHCAVGGPDASLSPPVAPIAQTAAVAASAAVPAHAAAAPAATACPAPQLSALATKAAMPESAPNPPAAAAAIAPAAAAAAATAEKFDPAQSGKR
mmetsp:Transcript_99317/g.318672  ORF Transcript_99317/g.318672 Transcript_99317/m.318672 type:complete len:460 (+) Transcript_99317:2-1381(+)